MSGSCLVTRSVWVSVHVEIWHSKQEVKMAVFLCEKAPSDVIFKILKRTFVPPSPRWLSVALWKSGILAHVISRVRLSWSGVAGRNRTRVQIQFVISPALRGFLSAPPALSPLTFFLTLKFAFKILVFLWESHRFQINLPWSARMTLPRHCGQLRCGEVSLQGAVPHSPRPPPSSWPRPDRLGGRHPKSGTPTTAVSTAGNLGTSCRRRMRGRDTVSGEAPSLCREGLRVGCWDFQGLSPSVLNLI